MASSSSLEDDQQMASAVKNRKKNLPIPVLVAFGAAVRREREALKYSQEAFADECGIDRSYMGGVERGERNLGMVNAWLIVSTLGLKPSEFFKNLDDHPPVTKTTPTSQV